MKNCKNCQASFEVVDKDRVFYEKISPVVNGEKMQIPEPTLCPDCRQQRRISYRNERNFYKRKCNFTGKEIVSAYSADKDCTVYDQKEWWSDKWDGTDFGIDFDFSRSFFEQYLELSKKVPRPALVNMSSENSVYTNHSAYNKNCYMCINTGYSEDLYYCSNYTIYCKNCTDCLAIRKSELCYFCIDCQDCFSSEYLDECRSCSDCYFCYDCQSCQNCFGSFNLRNKKYYIFNKEYSKEEYHKKLAELKPKTWNETIEFFRRFRGGIKNNAIHRFAKIQQCENCSGDHLANNKNVNNSFYVYESEDCNYCYDTGELKDGWDATEPFNGELHLETHACNLDNTCIACSKCYENNNIYYSQYCWYSSNLFGCFGLKHKEYCIFNKQYTKEEYFKTLGKIISHMQKTGEWGEFFPIVDSGFCYNETIANDYYPLDKNKALEKDYKWFELENLQTSKHENAKICNICNKQFLLIPQEITFYQKMNLPQPEMCSDCRHKLRFDLRPERKIYHRKCEKCQVNVQSVYSEEKAKRILCEKCYMKEIY